MQFSQKQLMILGGGLVLFLLLAILVGANLKSGNQAAPVTLKVWGTEPRENMEALSAQYMQYRPNVTLEYRQFKEEEYEARLTDALAAGEGPDVFMVANTAVARSARRLVPAPAAQFSADQLNELFPTVIGQETSFDGKIYALPLYLDTLALFYSKNSLDQAGITGPPRTWTDLQNYIPHLRRTDEGGQIQKAAAAIGGSERNVKHATELASLIMMQNGAPMAAADGSVRFTTNEGNQAFAFYLQFANPGSPSYTWNDSQPESLEAFAQGKAAMAFGYESDLKNLKNASPYLDAAVAPMLQVSPDRALNAARYQALGVSTQSRVPEWGWDFAIYAATNPDAVREFVNATHHPPALKAAIGQLVSSADLGVFARQALTARAWYRQDDRAIDQILETALRKVLNGELDSNRALRQAEEQVGQLMRSRQEQ